MRCSSKLQGSYHISDEDPANYRGGNTKKVITYSLQSQLMKTTLTLALALAALVAVPTASFAATYAYVNQSGEVSTVTADNASTAIATAPGIHRNSGVMLLSNPNDGITDDNVPVK